jgi:hypothetical protein
MNDVVKAAFLGLSSQSLIESAWYSNVRNEGKFDFAFPLGVDFQNLIGLRLRPDTCRGFISFLKYVVSQGNMSKETVYDVGIPQ